MSVERVRRDEGWCVRDERGEGGRGRWQKSMRGAVLL